LRKCLCKCGYTNGGKNTDYSVQDYNQGFAVNGGFEKVNYFSLNSTETTGISEAKPLNNDTTFENDTFQSKLVENWLYANKKTVVGFLC
jgi:vitamin B12 transporter